jgi:methyltransferase (TIGR00027 family)
MITAFARAAHGYIDDRPLVFDDPVAFDLLPGYQRRYIKRIARLSKQWLRRFRLRYDGFTAIRSHLVVRARYAEDALQTAREEHNALRYVVLGAGMDTFALRQTPPLVEVVEIDHPSTQGWKRALLERKKLSEPDGLTFLPVDFEQSSLGECWIDCDAVDFVSWLGVSYYLTVAAISGTLRAIAKRAVPGSQLVMDYYETPVQPDPSAPLFWGTQLSVALQQEPMRSFFSPKEIERLASAAGWRVRENCSAKMQNRRYLHDRTDGLNVPTFAHLLWLEL